MQNYKLHIYRKNGDIDRIEHFDTFAEMAKRYKEFYKKENGLLNPTAWQYKKCIENNINFGVMWCKISDVTMYNAITI